jgi:hypothetical protein
MALENLHIRNTREYLRARRNNKIKGLISMKIIALINQKGGIGKTLVQN